MHSRNIIIVIFVVLILALAAGYYYFWAGGGLLSVTSMPTIDTDNLLRESREYQEELRREKRRHCPELSNENTVAAYGLDFEQFGYFQLRSQELRAHDAFSSAWGERMVSVLLLCHDDIVLPEEIFQDYDDAIRRAADAILRGDAEAGTMIIAPAEEDFKESFIDYLNLYRENSSSL